MISPLLLRIASARSAKAFQHGDFFVGKIAISASRQPPESDLSDLDALEETDRFSHRFEHTTDLPVLSFEDGYFHFR